MKGITFSLPDNKMKDKIKAEVVADITIRYDGYNVIDFICHGVKIVKKEGPIKNRNISKKCLPKNMALVQ